MLGRIRQRWLYQPWSQLPRRRAGFGDPPKSQPLGAEKLRAKREGQEDITTIQQPASGFSFSFYFFFQFIKIFIFLRKSHVRLFQKALSFNTFSTNSGCLVDLEIQTATSHYKLLETAFPQALKI